METDEPNLLNNRKLGGGGIRSTKKAVLRTLINWARRIPGFNDLKNEDQVRPMCCCMSLLNDIHIEQDLRKYLMIY